MTTNPKPDFKASVKKFVKQRTTFDFLYRKKTYDSETVSETRLSRVLGVLDITAIGISSTLGSGIYVLAGQVIANYSGPSIIISFIIAGIATFFSGICYAELGARVPRSGSAYTYIYVMIGEFCAFIMGWDLILEYVLGTASIANALSQYINALSGDRIKHSLLNAMPMNLSGLGPYPDFLAFGLGVLVTIFMIIGVKESATANKLFTVLNISVLVFMIVCGATKANFGNWSLHLNSNSTWIDKGQNVSCGTTERCGKGGFAPFEFNGIIRGAAKCFYAYIGFDAIASTGEEVVNPKRSIPLSIVITLAVVSTLYCFLSGVITLMVPYYVVDTQTPLPQAFDYVGLVWAKHVVTVGAVLSLCTCLYASTFPMPRVIYSMASDGLIFKFLSKVMPKLKTPYVAAICSGLFAAVLATIFDLDQLVDMLSIGTLMAYSLVSTCVLLLRYQPDHEPFEDKIGFDSEKYSAAEAASRVQDPFWKKLVAPSTKFCTKEIARMVFVLTIIAILSIIALCLTLSHAPSLSEGYVIFLLILFCAIIAAAAIIIARQPQVRNIQTFKIPFVPVIPFLSVFINVYLMMTLTLITWARFIIWFVIGALVYFSYGIRYSTQNPNRGGQYWFLPCLSKKPIRKDQVLPDEKRGDIYLVESAAHPKINDDEQYVEKF